MQQLGTIPTFSQVSKIWNSEEVIQLFQADQCLQEIQRKIDNALKKVLNCPQIQEAYPLLSTYKSRLRKLELMKNHSLDNSKEVDRILSAIQKGESIKDNFNKLSRMTSKLGLLDIQNASCEELMEYREVLSKLIAFASDNESTLMIPTLNQLFYGLEAPLPEISKNILNKQRRMLVDLYENLAQIMLKSGEELQVNKKFLSDMDRIILIAAKSLSADPQFQDTDNSLGIGLALSTIMLARSEKKLLQETLKTKGVLEEAISLNEKLENSVCDFLNDDSPESVLRQSQQIVNDGTLAKIPLAARLKALKSLSEMDPIYSEFFKKKTMKFIESLLNKDLENKQREANKEANEPLDPCLLQ